MKYLVRQESNFEGISSWQVYEYVHPRFPMDWEDLHKSVQSAVDAIVAQENRFDDGPFELIVNRSYAKL